ncbi:unnamed protein product, partial [Urochloa humidicola]
DDNDERRAEGTGNDDGMAAEPAPGQAATTTWIRTAQA